MQFVPYLNFNGNCAEAVAFYEKVLGAQAHTMTYGQMPPSEGMPPLSPQDRAKVMHSSLSFGGQAVLFASDSLPAFCGGDVKPMQGMQVSINVDSAAEGKRIFDALSEGGQVQMPYEKTFWAEGFGMLTDRFGTPWMVNAELPQG